MEDLVKISILNHNWVTMEFGRNSYYEDKLLKILENLGFKDRITHDGDFILFDGEKP